MLVRSGPTRENARWPCIKKSKAACDFLKRPDGPGKRYLG
jgi:hypothetical protein